MTLQRARLYDIEEFKRLSLLDSQRDTPLRVSDDGGPLIAGLSKLVTPAFEKVEGRLLTLKFVISDEQVDRDRDTIRAAGWNLKNYRKNPVVLWAHDSHQLPIARGSVIVDGLRVISETEFTPRDLNPFGFMVHEMYANGFLNAVSVGFKPEKWEFVDESDTQRRGGINFLKQELLEYSAVPIPANPRALMLAHEVGIDLAPLTEWCVEFLDLDPKSVKVAARQEMEAVWSKLAHRKTYVEVPEEIQPEKLIVAPTFTVDEEMLIRVLSLGLVFEDAKIQSDYDSLYGKLLTLCVTPMTAEDLKLSFKLKESVRAATEPSDLDLDEIESLDFELEIENTKSEEEDFELEVEELTAEEHAVEMSKSFLSELVEIAKKEIAEKLSHR